MSEIQQQMAVAAPINPNPVHPNAKSTTHVNNGTTTTKANISSPVCRNCKTQTTPLWRRDETGQVLCNACGLFLKLHGRPRPISLKTDTIKSRNRIKQPNSSKNSTPNTPELKSKDSKPSSAVKKSPKLKKKGIVSENGMEDPKSLTPLLPPASSIGSVGNGSVFAHPLGSSAISGSFQHQTQPLHYPSSTPTHFAAGLQRITSPLLLSTTSSMSNARSTNSNSDNNMSAAQAAGALENMSNELGPSATFKGSRNGRPMAQSSSSPPSKNEESKFSTPSSALNVTTAPHTMVLKLPSINASEQRKPISSPSFGPQFHFQASRPQSPQPAATSNAATSIQQPQHSPSLPSLPPIHQVASHVAAETIPSYHSLSSYSHPQGSSIQSSQSTNGIKDKSENNYSGESSGGSGIPNDNQTHRKIDGEEKDNKEHNSNAGEITALKTRISELELVNDLYRTRIMELEAMEQAARMREASMRKLLDGYYNFSEHGIPIMKREVEDTMNFKNKKAKLDI